MKYVVIGSSLRQSRKQLGNTVNSRGRETADQYRVRQLGAALQGKVPGAQIQQTSGDPSGGISVRMRGTSTIKGSAEPLYVIDGVVVSNSTINVTNLNVSARVPANLGVGTGTPDLGTNRMADINPNDIEKDRCNTRRFSFRHLRFTGQQWRGADHYQNAGKLGQNEK